jgi:hypothetical protein
MCFGIVRQSSGGDDHPSANQFLFIYRLMSVASLIKPPKAASVQSEPVKLLMEIQSLPNRKHKTLINTLEENLDELLNGEDTSIDDDELDELLIACCDENLKNVNCDGDSQRQLTENCSYPSEVCDSLGELMMSCSSVETLSTESYLEDSVMACDNDVSGTESNCTPENSISFYVGGYVAHKLKKLARCNQCLNSLVRVCNGDGAEARLLTLKNRGGLLSPSQLLCSLLSLLEKSVDKFIYKPAPTMYQDIINDVLADDDLILTAVGCSQHRTSITSRCIYFYVAVRIHFMNREHNRHRSSRQEKHKHSKLSKLT